MYVCMYVCMYVFLYICLYVCVYGPVGASSAGSLTLDENRVDCCVWQVVVCACVRKAYSLYLLS